MFSKIGSHMVSGQPSPSINVALAPTGLHVTCPPSASLTLSLSTHFVPSNMLPAQLLIYSSPKQ